jgi:hypothetical protein
MIINAAWDNLVIVRGIFGIGRKRKDELSARQWNINRITRGNSVQVDQSPVTRNKSQAVSM